MGVVNKSTLVYEDLKNSIQSGEYAVGSNLPNEIVFSKQLGISRQTLRLALDQLEKEKLIVRYKHRGTFVHRKSYKEKTISVVVPRASYVDKAGFHSWVVAQYILEGVFGQARDAGMNMGIQFLHPDEQPLNESVEILLKTNAAGYVFPSLGGNAAIIKELVRRGGCAVVRHWCPLEYAHTVTPNEREGTYNAVKYLINSGRRKIAFFGPAGDEKIFFMERHLGYRHAMEESGLPVLPEFYRDCGGYPEDAHAATLQMLADGVRPDAIFCGTDMRAFGVMQVLLESKIRVPEDIAVIGFDNLPECEKNIPKLSSIDLHLCRSGELMCDIIKKAIDHPAAGFISWTLDSDFIKRDSC